MSFRSQYVIVKNGGEGNSLGEFFSVLVAKHTGFDFTDCFLLHF